MRCFRREEANSSHHYGSSALTNQWSHPDRCSGVRKEEGTDKTTSGQPHLGALPSSDVLRQKLCLRWRKKAQLPTLLRGWFNTYETHSVRNLAQSDWERNPADWESNIVEAWTDLIDPELDLHLHHVRPRPIQATTQTILGHVIVEQEATPTVTVVLTTIHSSTDSVVHLRQTALGIPRLLSRAGLLQRLPLSAADRARIPFFRVHLNEIPFGLFEIEEVEPGTHLDIYPPSYRPNLPAAPTKICHLGGRP